MSDNDTLLEQVGVVINTSGKFADIQIRRATACGDNCAKCRGCATTDRAVSVSNPIGAQVGDTVRVQLKAKSMLFAAFLTYILPLMLFFVGWGFGQMLYKNWSALVFATAAFAGSFVAVRKYSVRSGKNYIPTIVKIISR